MMRAGVSQSTTVRHDCGHRNKLEKLSGFLPQLSKSTTAWPTAKRLKRGNVRIVDSAERYFLLIAGRLISSNPGGKPCNAPQANAFKGTVSPSAMSKNRRKQSNEVKCYPVSGKLKPKDHGRN
jgi:hypothetical protein